jgi:hypothetical protein
MRSRRALQIGGIVAGGVLIAFGIVVIVLAVNGRNTVHDELQQQQITGTPDMTPTAIKAEAAKAGLKNVKLPTCDVAGQPIDDGTSARCFAQYLNIHALEATGGYTYSQMGIYTAKPGTPKSQLEPGGGTSNVQYAETDPKTGQPVQNASRQVWVTETALATALNVSYMATQLALFSLVVGIALLLTGIGFIVLALGGALTRLAAGTKTKQPEKATAATTS